MNRVASGKTDTLVLDFVNEPEQVQEAFQQYYQTTTLAEETDPNRLYDLQSQLEGFELYDEATIEEFCGIFYDGDQPDELLQGILDDVVERWLALEEHAREEFRSTSAELYPPLRIHLTTDYFYRCGVGEIVYLQSQSQQEAAETRSS